MESPSPVFFSTENEAQEIEKEQDDDGVTFEDLPEEEGLLPWGRINAISCGLSLEAKTVRWLIIGILLLGYNAFFVAAILYNHEEPFIWNEGWGRLVVITGVVYVYMFYAYYIKHFYCKFLSSDSGVKLTKSVAVPVAIMWQKFLGMKFTPLLINLSLVAGFFAFVVIDSQADILKLQSAFGIVAFVLLGAAFSKHPSRIKWRTIMWGLSMQFIMGLIVLRWEAGRAVLTFISGQVEILLDYTDKGSSFVYGPLVTQQPFDTSGLPKNQTSNDLRALLNSINESKTFSTVFAFKVLSVIFFVSFLVSMLFHVGAMQWVISKIGWMLQVTMGTTPCESLNAAANIFVGQTEAPLLIKPFLPTMTPSEIHAVMTGGFATIAGSVLAAYISFGIPADHLLAASVMSAPAALACAKLLLPETKKTKTSNQDVCGLKSEHSNILDAASQGALTAVFLVANIIGSLIAVLAFVAMVNGPLEYAGNLFDFHGLSLDYIFGKVFYPLAWLIGVDTQDLTRVGRLLGVKSIVNEFIAYSELRDMEAVISQRSFTIATYALCGFSNPSSIGMQIAAFSTLMPSRTADISRVAFRAYISGSIACFLTACFAGILIK